MRHISEILKPGAKLKAKKLTKKQIKLIDETVELQNKIPESIRYPHH